MNKVFQSLFREKQVESERFVSSKTVEIRELHSHPVYYQTGSGLFSKENKSYSTTSPAGIKENLLWIRRFETIEELRLALQQFKEIYNQTWIIERHGYQTPAQVRVAQIGHMPMAA